MAGEWIYSDMNLKPTFITPDPKALVHFLLNDEFKKRRGGQLVVHCIAADKFGALWATWLVARKVRHHGADGRFISKETYLQVFDPSKDDFEFLQVGNDMRTAHEAVARTFGIRSEEYDPTYEA